MQTKHIFESGLKFMIHEHINLRMQSLSADVGGIEKQAKPWEFLSAIESQQIEAPHQAQQNTRTIELLIQIFTIII